MVGRLLRIAIGLLLPLALAGCLLAPGKFVSKLIVNADRSFTFSYVGEVIAVDVGDDMTQGLGSGASGDKPSTDDSNYEPEPILQQIGLQTKDKDKGDDFTDKSADPAKKKAATEAKNKAIAVALSKEAGYRKAVYRGDGVFDIDYQISGKLTHSFIYPFNIDAELVFPFIAVELRANGTVRMKAPAFANENSVKSGMSMPGADSASDKLDGVFTLDTDAEIVSQNNEDGAVSTGGRKTVTWKATPTLKTAPMAVLRFTPIK